MAREKAYTVELSENGHKRKEVYYAKNARRAGRQAEEEHADAIIYEVDTL